MKNKCFVKILFGDIKSEFIKMFPNFSSLKYIDSLIVIYM